jgi:hypothetical protein
VRVAIADPPYLGCCNLYDHHHPDGRCWDAGETHRLLIDQLVMDFPDGWALSCSTPSLRTILPLCPEDVRVMAWVKPFASFKPFVNPAYAWEPVIVRGGRSHRDRAEATVRDWCAVPITLKRGLTGAKPAAFCYWLFEVLGLQPGDELVDMFVGSGAVTVAWEQWQASQHMLAPDACDQLELVTP